MQTILSQFAPAAMGPYSQAIKTGKTVYFSGQIPLNPQTMELVSSEFSAQAEQTFKNLQAVAMQAGGSLSQVVKLTVYLTDLSQFPVFNQVMERFFTPPYPARTTIQVSALPKAAQIEVEAIMVLSQGV